MKIPSRITQSWIERTVPLLNQMELGQLLNVMRERNWSDDDIADRVLPYATRDRTSSKLSTEDVPPAATNSVELVCPRGRANHYTAGTAGSIIEINCPSCRTDFAAVANVVCTGIARERYSRTSGYRGLVISKTETKLSAVIRLRYRNPAPPPTERLVEFLVGSSGAELQVRSGDRISILFKKGRKGFRPYRLTNHTLGRTWPLKSESLSDKLFDLVF
jgi:hypothetical protein